MLQGAELMILSIIVLVLGIIILGLCVFIFYLKKKDKDIVASTNLSSFTAKGKVIKNEEILRHNNSGYRLVTEIPDELKNLLKGIIKYSGQFPESDALDRSCKNDTMDFIHLSGHILEDILDSITELDKIEKKQIILTYAECSLSEILNDLLIILKNNLLDKTIELVVEKGGDEADFSIYSDEKRIKQVLYFLLNYTFKNTNQRNIKIGYKIENLFIIFYIEYFRNTTTLIGKDILTEKQFPEECKNLINPENFDLGLYLARGIVENLDGKIWLDFKEVDSDTRDKENACIYFTIPFQGDRKSTLNNCKEVGSDNYIWPNKTVLIVEDAFISYELLTKFLKNSQINIIHAADGLEAVDFCKGNKEIDLVLMDIQLPIMDGLEATNIIKEFRPGLPIIAQTANALEDERSNVIKAGCDDYISKPINRLELLQKINNFLGEFSQ